jgi:hypothetical protein
MTGVFANLLKPLCSLFNLSKCSNEEEEDLNCLGITSKHLELLGLLFSVYQLYCNFYKKSCYDELLEDCDNSTKNYYTLYIMAFITLYYFYTYVYNKKQCDELL